MARARARATPPATNRVTVRYDLFDLPTAQHKAGLAGLVLQIESMKTRRHHADSIPDIVQITATTATVQFTAKSIQALFDDLYDAEVVEADRAVRRVEAAENVNEGDEEGDEVDGEETTTARRGSNYRVQPRGHFLRQYLPDMDPAKDWHKLWRDMLWTIPRGQPQTRIPFELRAGWDRTARRGGAPIQSCKEGKGIWHDLLRMEEAMASGGVYTDTVAGSLWLGAQEKNAEAMQFRGRVEQTLLLHFWPLTALVFAPQQIDDAGNGNLVGYVLAIPEVADLENFNFDYPTMLAELSTAVRGYRPAEAILDLPAQGALAFLEHLARLAQLRATTTRITYSIASVEFLHLAKFRKSIKSMAAGRVAPRPELLDGYRAVVGGPGERPPFRNPFFRRCLMLALLNDQLWYKPFASLLVERPWKLLLRSDEAPRGLPSFWVDAARKLDMESEQYSQAMEVYRQMDAQGSAASLPPPEKPLAVLVGQLVRSYLFSRAQERSGINLRAFQPEGHGIDWDRVPAEFNECKQKLAQSAFLEFRSRHDQAFVDHFVATFCSVKQYLSDVDYQLVAKALLDRSENGREDMKTLTLLALSANS